MIEIKTIGGSILKIVDADDLREANLCEANLCEANLRRADLREAKLSEANLRKANLDSADLRRADLRRADLYGADLRGAYLRGADLYGADLRRANLSSADLREAKLSGADLREADLRRADLREADLDGAMLPHFQIPDGSLTVWKQANGKLVRLRIPPTAKRTASLVGHKCRAEFAYVEWIESSEELTSNYDENTKYITNTWVYPDSYDDDIRVECSHGIHFFLTRAEAEEWEI